jgi:hypothetical protein
MAGDVLLRLQQQCAGQDACRRASFPSRSTRQPASRGPARPFPRAGNECARSAAPPPCSTVPCRNSTSASVVRTFSGSRPRRKFSEVCNMDVPATGSISRGREEMLNQEPLRNVWGASVSTISARCLSFQRRNAPAMPGTSGAVHFGCRATEPVPSPRPSVPERSRAYAVDPPTPGIRPLVGGSGGNGNSVRGRRQ